MQFLTNTSRLVGYSTLYSQVNNVKNYVPINPLTAECSLRALIDFTLSNARRFYSSMGNPLDRKGLSVSFLKCAPFKLALTCLKGELKYKTLFMFKINFKVLVE